MDEVSPQQAGDADPTRLTRRTVLQAAAGGFGLFFVARPEGCAGWPRRRPPAPGLPDCWNLGTSRSTSRGCLFPPSCRRLAWT
jgi:hypothetical protein